MADEQTGVTTLLGMTVDAKVFSMTEHAHFMPSLAPARLEITIQAVSDAAMTLPESNVGDLVE